MPATFLQGQDAKIITSGEVITSENQAGLVENVSLTGVTAAGALTVALRQADGTDATASNPVRIGHLSDTLTVGTYAINKIIAALSVVVPSGATLGYSDGDDARVHVYGLDNAGTEEIAVSGSRVFKDFEINTTVAIGTGSDLGTALYSTTQRTAITTRYLGFIQVDAITTAGTWTAPDSIRMNQTGHELNKKQFAQSSSFTGNVTNATASFSAFSSALTLTFVAENTGIYKILALCPLTYTAAAQGFIQLNSNSGSPTNLVQQTGEFDGDSSITAVRSILTFRVDRLTAGTTYVYEIFGLASTGTLSMRNDRLSSKGGMTIIAEEI